MDKILNKEGAKNNDFLIDLNKRLEDLKKYGVPTNSKKWLISLFSGVLFFIIASPMLFQIVNYLTSKLGVSILDYQGKPNMIGYVLHTIVFILIVRLSMQ